MVVDYAAEAKRHGAVYLEAIFSPIERTWRGVVLGRDLHAATATGRRRRASCTASRCSSHRTSRAARRSRTRYDARPPRRPLPRPRDRRGRARRRGGLLPERAVRARLPRRPRRPASARSRTRARSSARNRFEPRSTISSPTGIRHGFRAIEDPALVEELADRGLVLDVTPISNVRTGAVRLASRSTRSRQLVAAGVRCSVSTDDPVMFDTDLTREYEAAESRSGSTRVTLYETALAGALCDEETRARLRGNSLGIGGYALTRAMARAAAKRRQPTRHHDAPTAEAQGQRRPALRGHAVLQPAAQAGQVGVRLPRRRLRPAASCSSASARRTWAASPTSSTGSAAAARASRRSSKAAEGDRRRTRRTRHAWKDARDRPTTRRATSRPRSRPGRRTRRCARRTSRAPVAGDRLRAAVHDADAGGGRRTDRGAERAGDEFGPPSDLTARPRAETRLRSDRAGG